MPDAKRYPLGLVIEEDASKASVLIGLLEEVGMDVREEGEERCGARFVIRVPKDMWRWND